ncbi:uncharacterized protein HD556DRAFT_1305160 [Suillus plorans]|uniref:Uncharacterized protein n=1 Tax=Suillus plorans TaxID=116603 RepID=A0A9P7J359_9AGAM|nr:uncharacterized protein HD556DRAFT_1305160 [Suillus plorans]KAG1800394.1 hypothetical protein HD556DRAFT_1305160 [Suillus plorans]
MDNQRPSQGSQNRSDLQRDYRERERLAFRRLLGALNEVDRTNPRSRREILRQAAECLRRLGQEQIDLQRQLVFPNNVVGTASQPEVGTAGGNGRAAIVGSTAWVSVKISSGVRTMQA